MIEISKGEVYVLNQPKHKLISILVVDEDLKDSVNIHNSIDRLVKISDVFFIFSDSFFPDQVNINKEKFTSLYQACGFIDCPGFDIGTYLFKLFSYSKEIFNQHVGYVISLFSDLLVNENFANHLLKLNSSAIMKPVFKLSRLNSNDLREIYYKKRDEVKKESLIDVIKNLFKDVNPEKVRDDEIKGNDDFGKYCCYGTYSNMMFFRNGTINIFLNYYEDPEIKRYVETFSFKYDPKFLLASMTKRFGIDNLNYNIEDIEVK